MAKTTDRIKRPTAVSTHDIPASKSSQQLHNSTPQQITSQTHPDHHNCQQATDIATDNHNTTNRLNPSSTQSRIYSIQIMQLVIKRLSPPTKPLHTHPLRPIGVQIRIPTENTIRFTR